MTEIINIDKLKQSFERAKSILIVLSDNYSQDELAAALALFLVVKNTGKKVSIFSPKAPIVEQASLFGVSEVRDKLLTGSVIVSVPSALTSVDKVTHYLDGETLNIVIHPLENQSIPQDKVAITKSSSVYDLVVLVNVAASQILNFLTPTEQETIAAIPKVFIGNFTDGLEQEVQVAASENLSISELVFWILEKLELPLNADAASNLFQGIQVATDFKPPKATPSTFEAAAICLKHNPISPKNQQEAFVKTQTQPQTDFLQSSVKTSQPDKNFLNEQVVKVKEQSDFTNEPQDDFAEFDDSKIQADWYFPKIFKSSSKTSKRT